MFLGFVRGQFHAHHEIGGVSSGTECASSVTGLVERSRVGHFRGNVIPLARLQPHLEGGREGGRRGERGVREGEGREGGREGGGAKGE